MKTKTKKVIPMMRPLRLNTEGDTICQSYGQKVREDWYLASFFGVHWLCGGSIHVVRISAEHLSVNCSDCGRLIVIPSSVDTVGRLRAHCRGVEAAKEGRGRRR